MNQCQFMKNLLEDKLIKFININFIVKKKKINKIVFILNLEKFSDEAENLCKKLLYSSDE